jgi:hypothetical protein
MKCKLCALASALLLICAMPAARAAVLVYTAALDGPSEPTTSPGTGSTTVTYDDVLHTLRVQLDFSGLVTMTSSGGPSGTTAAHIHAPTASPFAGTAGVATQTPTFSSLPLGVQAGSMDQLLDLTLASSWNPAFITANGGTVGSAEVAFASAVAAGKSYLNIHSNAFPGGEIRGFLAVVPEPATAGLAALGWACLAQLRRRR